MSGVKQLYTLQETDVAIADKQRSLADVSAILGEDSVVAEARNRLKEEENNLDVLLKKQKELEWEVEELIEKIIHVDKQMYGGSVKNPKELSSLSEECDHFKVRRGKLEDQVLDIMTDIEVLQGKVAQKKNEFDQVEDEWKKRQDDLSAKQAGLKDELVSLEEKRRIMLLQIDKPSIELYESLKRSKQGMSVARVEQGMCQGCRINLPMTRLKQARMGQELVQCSNCGRILFVS